MLKCIIVLYKKIGHIHQWSWPFKPTFTKDSYFLPRDVPKLITKWDRTRVLSFKSRVVWYMMIMMLSNFGSIEGFIWLYKYDD
jgi:hypothetical protein